MTLPATRTCPALLLVLAATAAPAATLVVDDDRVQCPAAGFTAIQAAVDAAAPGDTVRVCAGDYPERVAVSRRLRLLGAQAGVDARTRSHGGPGESVVRSPDPFTIGANWTTLDGFSIVVQLDAEGEGRGLGLSGYGQRILNNLFEDSAVSGIIPGNVTGEYPVTIRRNHFRGRWGIAADSEANASNLLIADNLFVDASVLFAGAPHSNIRLLRNRFRWEPAAPTACITQTQHQCRPIVVLAGTYDAIVSGNRMVQPDDGAISVSAGYNVLVEDNVLRAGVGDGIRIAGPGYAVTARGNDAGWFRYGAGVHLDDTADAVVAGNTLHHNDVGIDVSALSSGNTLSANQAHDNRTRDCRDASIGGGTSGTANTWTGNVGATSTPAGLCPP